MQKKEVTVKSVSGLHARPGSDLVELAIQFPCDIKLIHNEKEINAKEVLEVLMANINCGDLITVVTEGNEEEAALEAIAHYIETTE